MTHQLVSTPEVLGGTPCFHDTHVPLSAVIEAIIAQATLDDFLAEHPAVEREDVEAALDELKQMKYSSLSIDPERMGGSPCFPGTRVPFYVLTDYFIGGSPLSEFEADFPWIDHNDIISTLREAIAHATNVHATNQK